MAKIIITIISIMLIFTACYGPEESVKMDVPNENLDVEDGEIDFSINDIDSSLYDEIKDMDFMYVLTKIEGTRKCKKTNDDGLSLVGEEPNEKIWIVSKDGEFLNEEPFQKYNFFEGNDGEWWVYGINNGILYPFYIYEDTGDVKKENPWKEEPEVFFGYSIFKYYWEDHTPYYGIIAPDGSIFAEPIYHKIVIPCNNRIILFDGNNQVIGQMVCSMVDFDKNVILKNFNYIHFYTFEDGYNIALAMRVGNEVDEKKEFYDSNGNPLSDGYWFIDNDGNIISNRFLGFESEWLPEINSPNETIVAFDENGNSINIKVSNYLFQE